MESKGNNELRGFGSDFLFCGDGNYVLSGGQFTRGIADNGTLIGGVGCMQRKGVKSVTRCGISHRLGDWLPLVGPSADLAPAAHPTRKGSAEAFLQY